MEKKSGLQGSIELLETILQSESILESTRKFLFSEINDFSHSIAVCSFSTEGLVRLEHVEGKVSKTFQGPESIWDSRHLNQALRTKSYVGYTDQEHSYHLVPLISNGFPIGAVIFVGEPGAKMSAWIRRDLKFLQILVGYFLDQFLKASASTLVLETNDGLSPRQLSILELLSEGLTNGQIASKLHLSISTVGQELIRVYRFLKVSKRADAGQIAKNLNYFVTAADQTLQAATT